MQIYQNLVYKIYQSPLVSFRHEYGHLIFHKLTSFGPNNLQEYPKHESFVKILKLCDHRLLILATIYLLEQVYPMLEPLSLVLVHHCWLYSLVGDFSRYIHIKFDLLRLF